MREPHQIIEYLRHRADLPVTKLGPAVGMSAAWGQRVLDGTICPDLVVADRAARVLCARPEERLVLLESVSRKKLSRAGIVGEDLDRVIGVLLEVYK